MIFECFDGIHDACSVRSVDFRVPGSFRLRGWKVNNWFGKPGWASRRWEGLCPA
jgi:hypothetical protein